MRTSLVLFTAATLMFGAACKKKEQEAAPKPAEGSTAVVPPTTPPGTPPVAPPATPPATPPVAATKNIVELAREAGTFTTLLKAVEAAGLVETLSAPGPITLFAPTDEAFAKLPPKDLEALLADKAKLTALLTYHVVPGALAAKDLAAQPELKTASGASVPVASITVVKPDLPASNGVIHVIDAVLVPPA